jgi:hypothetical protein
LTGEISGQSLAGGSRSTAPCGCRGGASAAWFWLVGWMVGWFGWLVGWLVWLVGLIGCAVWVHMFADRLMLAWFAQFGSTHCAQMYTYYTC